MFGGNGDDVPRQRKGKAKKAKRSRRDEELEETLEHRVKEGTAGADAQT